MVDREKITDITKEKEDDIMGSYVKPIQATPTLTGDDAIAIMKQVFTVPSSKSIEKNKKLLEMRKRIEKK